MKFSTLIVSLTLGLISANPTKCGNKNNTTVVDKCDQLPQYGNPIARFVFSKPTDSCEPSTGFCDYEKYGSYYICKDGKFVQTDCECPEKSYCQKGAMFFSCNKKTNPN